jgi:hypothetical protein
MRKDGPLLFGVGVLVALNGYIIVQNMPHERRLGAVVCMVVIAGFSCWAGSVIGAGEDKASGRMICWLRSLSNKLEAEFLQTDFDEQHKLLDDVQWLINVIAASGNRLTHPSDRQEAILLLEFWSRMVIAISGEQFEPPELAKAKPESHII